MFSVSQLIVLNFGHFLIQSKFLYMNDYQYDWLVRIMNLPKEKKKQ